MTTDKKKQNLQIEAVKLKKVHGFFVFGDEKIMKLEDWRNEIDMIDAEIVRLINHRASIAKKIGVLKTTAGLPIVDGDREEKMLRGICEKNSGVLTDESLIRIFRQIIRESKQIQTNIAGKILESKTEIYR